MTIAPHKQTGRAKHNTPNLLFERGMALLATVNLVLVLFDLSYVSYRNFWLQGRVQFQVRISRHELKFPPEPAHILPVNIAKHYDWVKGIESHRDTVYYQKRVEDLKQKIEQIDILTQQSIKEPITDSTKSNFIADLAERNKEREAILAELRELSVAIIETNPFQVANKEGTLEKLKNRMRRHIFDDDKASAKKAFGTFWSSDYLLENNWRTELNFYDQNIKPLLALNYYRPMGENGQYIDNFTILDFPFFVIFLLEFLARSWYISRRHTGVTWFDAMLWRWYDVFLLLPLLRWLRVIPVVIRLDQSRLINLSSIHKQASQGFVASIAEDITEIVFIRIINQVQGSINRGEFATLLSQTTGREYVDLNDTNEPIELAKLMVNLVVNQVLPKIQPEAEALIKHTIERVVNMSPAYQGLQILPGIDEIKVTLAQQISHQLYQITSDTLRAVMSTDPVFDELFEALVEQFTGSITSEIQAKESIERMESLINDLLEEVKVNYVERLSNDNVEDILEQTRVLRQMTR